MKQKQVYRGAIDLKIKVIDWTKINEVISNKVQQDVECRLGNGFIEDVEAIFDKDSSLEIKCLIIDNECCGSISDSRNFYVSELNAGEPFTVNLFKGIGFYKVAKEIDGGKGISMFPSFYFDIDIDDVKNCLTGEEIPLYQFMGSRYAYNDRIITNEIHILKLCYFDEIKAGDNWKQKELMEIED
jgi:hypothetical protein